MYVVCHCHLGYVKSVKFTKDGPFIEFSNDPSDAIRYILKQGVYCMLAALASFRDVDIGFYEIHQLLGC